MCSMQASHLLQKSLNEPLLLRAVSGELMALASVRVELAPCLKAKDLQLWVTAVINDVEQVDKDTPENLRCINDARATRSSKRCSTLPSDTARPKWGSSRCQSLRTALASDQAGLD
jgi:hypothetical protein